MNEERILSMLEQIDARLQRLEKAVGAQAVAEEVQTIKAIVKNGGAQGLKDLYKRGKL